MKVIARPRKKLKRRRMKECAEPGIPLAVGKIVRRSLVERVQKGDVRYARRLTRSRTVIVLEYAGEEIAFLYSRESKQIISFLSLDAPEIEGWRDGREGTQP